MERSSVKILGARGSVPRSGAQFDRFGGATVCVFARLAGQPVVLDAGTGLLELGSALRPAERKIPLLLTHAHADHLLGLPICACALSPEFSFDVYAAARGGLCAEAQVKRLLSPPLWPAGPEALPAAFRFFDLPEAMALGPVTVETLEGDHPGGVSILRLTGGGARIVLATDCRLCGALFPRLAAFAADCDLLLADGQYAPAEWAARSGFGHSTYADAARFGRECGAKRTLVIHHDPERTDDALDRAAAELEAICPNCGFARAGEEIFL